MLVANTVYFVESKGKLVYGIIDHHGKERINKEGWARKARPKTWRRARDMAARKRPMPFVVDAQLFISLSLPSLRRPTNDLHVQCFHSTPSPAYGTADKMLRPLTKTLSSFDTHNFVGSCKGVVARCPVL